MSKGAGSAAVVGAVDGQDVVVADPAAAKRLQAKAQAGTLRPGGALRLSLVEAAHCMASGWLAVEAKAGQRVGSAQLLADGADGRRSLDDYLAYRDLRERGYVVRHADVASRFDVWPRGTAEGKPAFQVVAASASNPVGTADLLEGARGEVVRCVVDEDSAVTHYRLAMGKPKGGVPEGTLPPADGDAVADRVLVADLVAAKAYAAEFLGAPHGDGLLLSPLEAAALQGRGLRLRQPLTAPPAPEVLAAYGALRAAGVVAKSGLRFGAHLRGYAGAPDDAHAEWLLHCARDGEALPWSAIARGVRLAHGVRKKFLVSVPTPSGVRFVHVAWFRP